MAEQTHGQAVSFSFDESASKQCEQQTCGKRGRDANEKQSVTSINVITHSVVQVILTKKVHSYLFDEYCRAIEFGKKANDESRKRKWPKLERKIK